MICIWCQKEFERLSIEHGIPQALGCPDALVMRDVICARCNTALGMVDQALLKQFEVFTVLCGVPREKGRRPTIDNWRSIASKVLGHVWPAECRARRSRGRCRSAAALATSGPRHHCAGCLHRHAGKKRHRCRCRLLDHPHGLPARARLSLFQAASSRKVRGEWRALNSPTSCAIASGSGLSRLLERTGSPINHVPARP
jgi:hypothetical protein